MAVWTASNIKLTQRGQELLSRVQMGIGQLSITKVMTGAGRVADANLFTQTAVTTPKQTMAVTKVTTMSTGSTLELQVTNTGLAASYSINQIGVYATHPDMGEILYMIAQCESGTADTMPLPSVTPVTMNYMFYLIHSALTQLDITVDPAGLVTVGTFNEHLEDFQELCDFVGYNDTQVYGTEIDFENHTYERLGANIGMTAGSAFNDLTPWGGRRRCNLTDDGVVLSYYGDAGYTETGALTQAITVNGTEYPIGTKVQVMVEQPKFWYKTIPVKMEKQENQRGYSLCKARYYISVTPRIGFNLFPAFRRGIPLADAECIYLPAYRGSIFDVSSAQAEVNTMTFAQGATTAGNITITLDGYNDFTVALQSSDNTADLVAARVRAAAASFTGWLVSGTGANVIFTSTSAGARNTAKFTDTGSTGASATVTKTTSGAGGYVENDAQCADFADVTGDMLCSVAGVKPASGLSQNLTRHNVTVLCNNRNYDENGDSRFDEGFGWQQKDLSANHVSAWLHLIEYNTLNCQTTIGQGVCNLTDDGATNMAYKNGDTSALGNASGRADGIDGKCSVTYRGEENNWGNGSYWEEGLNVEAKNRNDAYISTTGIYTDNVGESQAGYVDAGFSLAKASGYVSRVGYSEDCDWAFLATKCNGSSSYPIHDYFYQSYTYNGWCVSGRSCYWYTGAAVGLCSRLVNSPSGYRTRNIGGCLLFVRKAQGTPAV